VSGCELPADIDFDSSALPGYSSLHAAQKTQLYCKLSSIPLPLLLLTTATAAASMLCLGLTAHAVARL